MLRSLLSRFGRLPSRLPRLLSSLLAGLLCGLLSGLRCLLRGLRGLLRGLRRLLCRLLSLLLARTLLLDLTDNERAKFLFDDISRNSLVFGHLAEMSSNYFLAQGGRAGEARRDAPPAFDRLANDARGDFMTRLWLFYDAYVYGCTMELSGDRAEAARGYLTCITANPNTELAARSRQRLALLEKRH